MKDKMAKRSKPISSQITPKVTEKDYDRHTIKHQIEKYKVESKKLPFKMNSNSSSIDNLEAQ